MEPEYPVGCAVYVKEIDFEENKNRGPYYLSFGDRHRFSCNSQSCRDRFQQQAFITKGDANQSADVDAVSYSQVVGKVVFQIPLLGRLSACLHTKTGVLACGGVFAAAMVLWVLAEKMKVKESAK